MKKRHAKEKLLKNMGKTYVEESFIPSSEYPTLEERELMEEAPPFDDFPDGMYILGTKGFAELIGYSATSQIDSYMRSEKMAKASVNN